MTDFWNRVLECDHKNMSPDYCEYVPCPTPLCNGDEEHCLDCGVYITLCKCGYVDGLSGWSHKRWMAAEREESAA